MDRSVPFSFQFTPLEATELHGALIRQPEEPEVVISGTGHPGDPVRIELSHRQGDGRLRFRYTLGFDDWLVGLRFLSTVNIISIASIALGYRYGDDETAGSGKPPTWELPSRLAAKYTGEIGLKLTARNISAPPMLLAAFESIMREEIAAGFFVGFFAGKDSNR